VASALALPSLAAARQFSVPPPAEAERITVAAGTLYEAGAPHRWVAGSAYPYLWAMPIRVPVLDLHTYARGLHPTAVLMVMADDAALGTFRRDFAGRLGMLEEYPYTADPRT
jgi:hypothetical protein